MTDSASRKVRRRAGAELTERPLRERCANLKALLAAEIHCLQLVTHSEVVEDAEEWLALRRSIEGVVARRADGRYLAGQRD